MARQKTANVTLSDEIMDELERRYPQLNRSARIRVAALKGIERYERGIGRNIYIPHGTGVRTYTFQPKPEIIDCIHGMPEHLSKSKRVAILVIVGLGLEDKNKVDGGEEDV